MGLLDGLSQAERELVLFRREERTVTAGTLLFRRGDPPHHVYHIISGEVEITALTTEGTMLPVARYGSGENFGLAALFPGTPARLTTATAMVETTLVEFQGGAAELLRQQFGSRSASQFQLNLLAAICTQYIRLRDSIGPQGRIRYAQHPDYPMHPEKWLEALGDAVPDGLFTRLFNKTRYKAGEYIVREGEVTEAFHVLKFGAVRVTNARGEDELLRAPDVVGDYCLFAGVPQEYTVKAEIDTVALPFSKGAIESLMNDQPATALKVVNSLLALVAYRMVALEARR